MSMRAALRNSELCESSRAEEVIENVPDRLRFLAQAPCDISADLEFISSHSCQVFSHRWEALKSLPVGTSSIIVTNRPRKLDRGFTV
jgi:hypothetical protein